MKQELNAVCSILKNCGEGFTLVEVLKKIGKMAFSDEISGLANRTYFNYYLEKSIKKARLEKETLAVVLFDVDNFKKINEVYGHSSGDKVISQFPRIFGSRVRSVQSLIQEKDLYCRYGDDEFAVVLPGSASQAALRVAERIRSGIQNFSFAGKEGVIDRKITASFGVALFNPDMKTPHDMIEQADAAMLRAKKKGKNCVVMFEDNAI